MATHDVSVPTLQRLPAYLQQLKRMQLAGETTVSCNSLAVELNLNPVLVRKDLAAVSSIGGRPKIGYQLDNLIVDVEHYLGYMDCFKAVLVGLGHLGGALFAYPGFSAYGVQLVAGFDSRPEVAGTTINGKPVMPMEELAPWCKKNGIELGIITVPAANAQEVCDQLAAAGIRGIWNFAPTHLRVPDGVLVQNEDMAVPLALLSQHLKNSTK